METRDSTATSDTRTWLYQTCRTLGCTVVVRSLPGQQPTDGLCQWCRSGAAYNHDQIRGKAGNGPLMSKEEFGVDLFEAIRTQSALRQAEKTAAIYRKKGLKRQERESLDQVKSLNHQLSEILKKNTIDGPDLQRLMAIT